MIRGAERRKSVRIDPAGFSEPGLYLLFGENERLDLTRRCISEATERFLSDPLLIPDEVRQAADYAPCKVCPEKNRAVICHSILPTLPFVGRVERYLSSDYVTAVYVEADGLPLSVVHTDMQQALVFVAILSLIEYCEVGRRYARYFHGVDPLDPSDRIAERIHQNLVLAFQGDLEMISAELSLMEMQLQITTECQVKRLKLISQSDAFLNAFVNTQATATWLLYEVRGRLSEAEGQG